VSAQALYSAPLVSIRTHRLKEKQQSSREGIKRPQLEKAIDALSRGDVLIVGEWDRATRSLLDGIRIIERVAAKGAMLKAWIDSGWLVARHYHVGHSTIVRALERASSIA
jgi:hypothetical protein